MFDDMSAASAWLGFVCLMLLLRVPYIIQATRTGTSHHAGSPHGSRGR